MPKIRVKGKDAYCKKCKNVGTTDRHHYRHEKLFIEAWAKRRKRQIRYRIFKRRYARFNQKDTVRLCRDCHQDIHRIYTYLLSGYRKAYNRKVETMTWKQANVVMGVFKGICKEWLK